MSGIIEQDKRTLEVGLVGHREQDPKHYHRCQELRRSSWEVGRRLQEGHRPGVLAGEGGCRQNARR